MKRFIGGLMLLMGVALATWIGYSRLSGAGGDRSPLAGLGFCLGLIVVGRAWVRRPPPPVDDLPNPDRSSAGGIPPVSRRTRSSVPVGGSNLDLSKMTPAALLLLDCAFVFFFAEALCLALFVPNSQQLLDDKRWGLLIGVTGIVFAIGFFQVGKVLLGWLGCPISKEEDD